MRYLHPHRGRARVTAFSGLRVLVVEDEATVAMLIEDMLEELGCEIAASVASVSRAMDIAPVVDVDLAMLDVNVAGEMVFPVALLLQERQIPVLFSTGYGMAGLPSEFSACQVLAKPFSQSDLVAKLALSLEH